MIRTSSYLFAAAGALALSASPLLAQQDLGRDGTSWRWDGALPSGGTLRLYSINGALHLAPASDGSVHVQATKHVNSGGDPRSVHYAVVRDGNNLVICALWNDDATCDANGMRGNGHGDHDDNGDRRNVTAEITVQIPAGVHTNGNTINGDVTVDRVDSDVRAGTVNGSVRVTRVSGQVRARTVNGDVTVDTRGGPVSAETVNGSVKVAMGTTGTTDMRFRTVSGDIDITAPAPLNADVELSTLNGSIESKYPLDFDRDHHRARGTVGNGSRHLSANTINGSITLH
jgi:hypothetical protein